MKIHTIITRLCVCIIFSLALCTTSCSNNEEILENPDINSNTQSIQKQVDLNPWEYETYNSFISDEHENSSLAKKSDIKWSYSGDTGPKFWGSLSPDFVLCAEGNSQSPIDIPTGYRTNNSHGKFYNDNDSSLKFFYKRSPLRVLNNTHTIQFSPKQGSYVKSNGIRYNLAQFHVHASSEHSINGRFSPLEIHFVHVNENNDKDLLVVGLLVEKGRYNHRYRSFWKSSNFPTEGNATLDVNYPINLARLLPRNKSRYNYSGSLTTPPCSEGVNWNVLIRKIRMSPGQIGAFTKLFSKNFRPVQDINDRNIVSIPDYFYYH